MTEEKEREFLREARDRLTWAMDNDSENRQLAYEDLKFAYDENAQWPDTIRTEREADGRPCITINKMPIFIDQVVGDQRQNRPSIKVVPVDNNSDPYVAEILGGWIKNVGQLSRSDIAIDHGFEHAVACGYGALRVITEYTDDDSFEQDVRIRKIDNALAVYWGPHTEYDCSDATYCFIISDITRDEFKAKYGDKSEPMPFNQGDAQYIEGWCDKDTVRVAEYFIKEPVTKTVYLLPDGRVVDALGEGEQAVKQRKVKGYKVRWYLLTGNKVLDQRDWVGKKYIPVIPIWGKEINIGGKRKVRGLIRFAKDAQRMYNFWNSCDTEQIALAPKSPFIVTPKQISGHEAQWKDAHRKNYPYLIANPDDKAPGWPTRLAPPQASSAMVQKLAQTSQEMLDTVGLQKASLGMQSNERSGRAIIERKKEGDVGTFAFIDNLARSIEHLGRVLVDVAPGILDNERIIRLGMENGLQKFEAINVENSEGNILNNITIGKYDVVVTVGPSFSTQRTEARQSMGEFIQYYPQAAPLIGDLFAKSMDWPGAEDMADRLAFLLPPEIKAKMEAEKAQTTGKPPEQPQQQPPEPSPMEIITLKQEQVNLSILETKNAQEKAKLEGIELDNQLKASQSKENIRQMIEEIIKDETDAQAGLTDIRQPE